MTPHQFLSEWRHVDLKERTALKVENAFASDVCLYRRIYFAVRAPHETDEHRNASTGLPASAGWHLPDSS
jgi:hypothetical protein